MPPTTLTYAWVLTLLTFPDPTQPTTPIPTPHTDSGGAWGEGGGLCGGKSPLVTPPEVDVTWERNSSQIAIHCPPKLRTFFPSLPLETTPPPPVSPLAVVGPGGRGVVLNLTHVVQEGDGGQVVVDVEGCGCVGVDGGLPEWVEGVTFAIRGSLHLTPGWYVGAMGGLRVMWVRVSAGLGVGEVCDYLPPTLHTLDVSHTPIVYLVLKDTCTPNIQRLEAIWSGVSHVSLCTPTLTTLYINNNEVGGDMAWAGCEGGVGGVMYLHANNNHLTAVSTCSWPSLTTLELKGNWLTSLDLTSCPPGNLTSLTAPKNYLTHAPSPLPHVLMFLDLSHNNISDLPVFPRGIKDVDFSHNNVHEIGEGRFERARRLHYLTLAHNHLTQITERDFYGLKKIHRLDLSHNKIKSISPTSLHALRHLRHLHLHHNHLTHLDARTLHALSNTHATMHDNPWACNCQMLARLTQLQACPECKHKFVALQCRERDHLQEVSSLLRTCLHAIQHTQGQVDESDEDLSEELQDDANKTGAGAVLIVPSIVVLIILSVTVACGYRLYKKHRRVIFSTFSPICGCCDPSSASGLNNNNSRSNHHHHQEASQLPTGELQDSDSETEM